MKGKLSRLCVLLIMLCLSLAMIKKTALAAEGDDRGIAWIEEVDCVRDSDYRKLSFKSVNPDFKDLEEYYKFIYDETGYGEGKYRKYVGCYSTGSISETRVTVFTKIGAKVSYSSGKNMKEASRPDATAGNPTAKNDVYYLHIPYKTVKNGGTFTIKAEYEGETKELKVVFAKPENKSVKWNKKTKAKLVVLDDSEYETIGTDLDNRNYGKISISLDNKEIECRAIRYEDVREGANLKITPGVEIGTYASIIVGGAEDGSGKEVEYPIRFGAVYNEDYAVKEKVHYVALDGKPTDTEWKIKSVIWNVNIERPAAVKIKIPAQKAAPKVKIDMINEKIGINANMEYRITVPFAVKSGGQAYLTSEVKNGKKGMTFADLEGVASGATIQVRIKGTSKKIPSAVGRIEIPSKQAIDLTKISAEGTASKCALKISDLDKAKNPYEYTCAEPTKTTKWKTLKSASVNLKKNEINETTPVIYVRQKALNGNAKKKIEMRQSSTIAVLTYDSTTQKWTAQAWDMSKLK